MDSKLQNNTSSEVSDVNKTPQPQSETTLLKPSGHHQLGIIIIAIAILIIAVIVGGIGYFLWSGKNNTRTTQNNTAPSKNLTENSTPQNYQTFSLLNTNFTDPDTALFFSDATILYKAKLDGSKPQELASLPGNITMMDILNNGTILINTDDSKYKKVVSQQPGDSGYRRTVGGYGYWMLAPNSGKPEKIDEQKSQALSKLKDNVNEERIYTKELPNGQADILLDKLDGKPPTKIGSLKEKPLKVQVCEVGNNCTEMKYPGEFYPSFNGSYLLNKLPEGGGLGEPGIVVSRDGSKLYKIDFYWYTSSAIWISDNMLLTKGQEDKQNIVTFKEDGTFSASPLQQDLGGYFSQNTLSPSGKLLFISNDAKNVSLYDLAQNKIIPIETLNEAQVRKHYNLLPEEIVEQRYSFNGWNKNSNMVMFFSSTGVFSSTHDNDRTLVREIKMFDIKTGKISKVATLNAVPKNTDDYVLTGKATSNNAAFIIW